MSQPDAPTIVIVGGVAGGASAATRARRANEKARILMFEKDDHVSFANCGLPYYIGGEIAERDSLLVASPELFRQRFGIEVYPRHRVTRIDPAARTVTVRDLAKDEERTQAWDRLILAPGAAPIVPPIPGVDASNVVTLRNLADTDRIKRLVDTLRPRHPVVVGAGFIGLEMVEQLHGLGLPPALVELQDQVLPPLDREMARLIEEELQRHDIPLHLGDGIARIELGADGSATGITLDSGRQLPADLVILGIGVRPQVELAREAGLQLGPGGGIAVNEFMQTSVPDIYAVGDAVEYQHGVFGQPMRIALAGPANRAGRLAGEHAATGISAPMTPPMGTAIVRVFSLAAAIMGASAKAARRMQLANRSVLVSPKHHAGYFPGGQTITLKLTYDPASGKVLGAQAVGEAGVDKRIDVVAACLKFGATVEDLAGLDLAYAPPYGSAKDPLHMAAFTAGNDLAGLTPIAEVDADLQGVQVVDVRSPREFDAFHLQDSHHIPLEQLRSDYGRELDPSRPTVTLCHSGQRGHVAARILRQHGFSDVRNLTGGIRMRRYARPEDVVSS